MYGVMSQKINIKVSVDTFIKSDSLNRKVPESSVHYQVLRIRNTKMANHPNTNDKKDSNGADGEEQNISEMEKRINATIVATIKESISYINDKLTPI